MTGSSAADLGELTVRLEGELVGWSTADPAHDMAHLRRVARVGLRLAKEEGADQVEVLCAAYLHDLVNPPKDSPERSSASRRSAEAAGPILERLGFDLVDIAPIQHAIHAHSFSARVEPRTIEAKVLQDADRMEALGAIGVARCFAVSGQIGRALMDEEDPKAERRALDDVRFSLDHFPVKLFRVGETLNTEAARRMAAPRIAFLKSFYDRLIEEAAGRA